MVLNIFQEASLPLSVCRPPAGDVLCAFLTNIPPPVQVGFGGLLIWLLVVRAFRWKRYNAIHRQYQAKYDERTMTAEEAQVVMKVSIMYDMPLLLNYSLAFALFKTYAIPSISELLAATKELKSKETVSRRYADTELLIATFVGCPISGFLDPSFAANNKGPDAQSADDPRAMIALARVNWLHSKYKISNDDFLYTLTLFVLEPGVWAERYGWRPLSQLEKYAFYVFWVEIGKKMGIEEIPESLEELIAFSKEYEERCMVPAPTNAEIAAYTIDELLSAAPEALGIKTFAQRITICLLDDVVRVSMMQPEQPWYMHALMKSVMSTIAFVQRWLLLPRLSFRFPVDVRLPDVNADASCPRLYPMKWQARPWYKPESTGLGYYRDKFLVFIGWHTEMPGPHLRSAGYRLEEMGPLRFEDDGHEEVMQQAAKLHGCPVTGPWSLAGRIHTSQD
ncbi:hypothetical protein BYT27DRAFT_7340340 [Phlegmacium glaucopus]|nr:hypothetical protein BYT27DRAFT_7340340 [Phlegmacium glaucopus]